MGEVWKARDTTLKREVAVKVLPETFARDPERMARFQREAEVLASLNHPNFATIYGVEERALIMELVEGESPKGPLPFDEAWKIASQIADALEYAHDKGIVHCDLKPANVKVTPDGVVKLLDFGLAKAFTGPTNQSSAAPVWSPKGDRIIFSSNRNRKTVYNLYQMAAHGKLPKQVPAVSHFPVGITTGAVTTLQ